MEHVSTFVLLFITLFLQCRAELTGPWYSANVINEGDFTPKQISSESPFSSTHPIVVLPPSSTAVPPISTSLPPSSYLTGTNEQLMSTYSTTPSTYPTQSSYVPPLPTTQHTIDPNSFPGLNPEFDIRQHVPFLFPQDKQPPPNYYVIYQAPQSPQNEPSTSPPESTWSTSQSPWSTPPSTWSTPQSTWSSLQPELSTPSTFSTQQPELTTPQTTFSTFQPEISTTSSTFSTSSSQSTLMSFKPSSDSTFPSNLPSSPVTNSPRGASTSTARSTRTTEPCVNGTAGILQKFPTLRIRMVAPSGSITNININPTTTTKKPRTRRSTTTRKPTTTRTKKSRNNRNTYNKCVDACEGGGRRPICASPLAQIPVDPSTLKGFPSVCHMACHNSFKKDQYEMVVEGRCGRLRTRIRTVDSDKLKQTELKKAQYTLVNDNQQTLVEVSALSRKGQ